MIKYSKLLNHTPLKGKVLPKNRKLIHPNQNKYKFMNYTKAHEVGTCDK